jgi:pimeloyl-ACP methyl ester carboxylesterase
MKSKSEARRYVARDGLEIFYWITPGKKTPYVLHPGGGSNHSSLERIERGLNDRGYATVVHDPRGVGHSSKPNQGEYYALSRYAQDIEGIIMQEGLERPRFLSHSFGFMPIVDYASRTANAELIVGVCASHNFVCTSINPAVWHFFDRVVIPAAYVWNRVLAAAYSFLNIPDRYPDESSYSGVLQEYLICDQSPKASLTRVRQILRYDVTQQLSCLETPMVLIHSRGDMMVRPKAADMIKALTRGACSSAMVNGPHWFLYKNPEYVLDVVDRYESSASFTRRSASC